tara:strand:- start:4365 stop:5024 length:660 start_codon:yes stop_codon:yes gene_type:complete
MNLLGKPGIQGANNSHNSVEFKEEKNKLKTDFDNNHSKKVFKLHYLVIGLFIFFLFFCLYVFSEYKPVITSENSVKISKIISEFNNRNNMLIKSMRILDDKVNIILSCESEGTLFENLYDLKSKYPNIKIKIKNNSFELKIEKDYINVANKIDDIIKILDDNNIDIEREFINNQLVVVGDINDIKDLFILIENNNMNNIQFDLNLLENKYNKIYYMLNI